MRAISQSKRMFRAPKAFAISRCVLSARQDPCCDLFQYMEIGWHANTTMKKLATAQNVKKVMLPIMTCLKVGRATERRRRRNPMLDLTSAVSKMYNAVIDIASVSCC